MQSLARPSSPALRRPELPSWVQDAILGQGAATESSPWEPRKGAVRPNGNLLPPRVPTPSQLALQGKRRGGDAETGGEQLSGERRERVPPRRQAPGKQNEVWHFHRTEHTCNGEWVNSVPDSVDSKAAYRVQRKCSHSLRILSAGLMLALS